VRTGAVAEPIAAFDVTFSPSKGESLLWRPTVDEQVNWRQPDAADRYIQRLKRTSTNVRQGGSGPGQTRVSGYER
jgi:hypothetical protein